MRSRVSGFIFGCALVPLLTLKALAFEVSANIVASVESDIGSTPSINCYIYAYGTETNKLERYSFASVPGVYDRDKKQVSCAPKLFYTFSEIGVGVPVGNWVAFKVVISVTSTAGYRTIVPYAGSATTPQNKFEIKLPLDKGIKL